MLARAGVDCPYMRFRRGNSSSMGLLGLLGMWLACAPSGGEGSSAGGTEASSTGSGSELSSGSSADVTGASTSGTSTDPGTSSGSAGSSATTGTSTGESTGASTGASTGGSSTTGDQPLQDLEDMSLGPYPSALTMLLDSIEENAASLNTAEQFSHSAGQGYVLQANAALLQAAWGHALPGGEATRDALVEIALTEIEELMSAADLVVGGGPAFGLEKAWDAFGDGSTNPAFTAYSWQSGMVALGIAETLAYVDRSEGRHDDQAARIEAARVFLGEMLLLWNTHYTEFEEDGQTLAYFWYSTEPADAKAVHNTSALVAMASQLHYEATGDPSFADRPERCARLLRKRATTTGKGGLSWHYVDDGWPVDKRVPEDVSHALVTLQFIRFAAERGWWSPDEMAKIASTLRAQIWSGNPARLHGRVDGSSGGASEWNWTRAAMIGFAVHGDALGGDPLAFDLARSLLVSSYLTPFDRPLEGATVDSVRSLAIGRLFEHRPESHAPDSRWSMVAGAGDDALPEMPGGVRFYTVDWGDATELTVASLSLPARSATSANANFLVDLEEGDERPVIVSLTYAATEAGVVQEWNGENYQVLTSLPATLDEEGTVRWMRQSLLLDPAIRFDYQGGVVGTNVLLQVSAKIDLHRIEATPF